MPVNEQALATASIRDLGHMLRTGKLTPTALAEYTLERLAADGRQLNAVVTLTRERALREARQAEAELAAGYDRGPLHGIPYGAKDLLATAGDPTTWGAAPYQAQTFDHDATVVARLSAAGAVLAAKLGMVELAGGMGYDHPDAAFTGPGRNPWDPSRWSGGSSSGSGSAVGARAVPFAIGSETHGSITTPAAFCGVSGLRPTFGRVSRHGAMALSWTMDKLGPICRTADDCGLVLGAIAGADPADPTTLSRHYSYRPDTERRSGFRLGVLKGAAEGAQPEVAANYTAALDVLRDFAVLEEVSLPDLPYQAAATIIIAAEASSAFDDLVAEGRIAELRAEADRVGAYASDTIAARDYLRALRVARRVAVEMDAVCAPFDALVAPTLLSVAPPLDQSFDRVWSRGGVPIGAAGNLAGLPAISVPSGFGQAGLPTAIQFVGRAFDESRILAIARAYQARTNWHQRLPGRTNP